MTLRDAGPRLAFGLAIVVTAGSIAFAQTQQPPRFRTEANFVRVDVYATQAGRPLTDLRLEDFEVLEDNVAQTISTFERVSVRAPSAQAPRTEPTSQREVLDAAARRRVSVIFLDRAQIGIEGAHAIRQPLIRFIDTAFGPDDLIGVMTADMAASQVTLTRKHELLAQEFRDNPFFGYQGSFANDPFDRDDRERAYRICYPELRFGTIAQQMIDRRRERVTLFGVRGPRPLSSLRPRGAEGDPRHLAGMAAVHARRPPDAPGKT